MHKNYYVDKCGSYRQGFEGFFYNLELYTDIFY